MQLKELSNKQNILFYYQEDLEGWGVMNGTFYHNYLVAQTWNNTDLSLNLDSFAFSAVALG